MDPDVVRIVFIFTVAQLGVIGAMIYILDRAAGHMDRQTAMLRWYRHWFRERIGYHVKFGDYHLASFDCGRTYHHVHHTDDKPIMVDGYGEGRHGFIIGDEADDELVRFTQDIKVGL